MPQKKNDSNIIWLTRTESNTIPENLGTAYINQKLTFTPMSFGEKNGHYVKIVASDVYMKTAAFMNAKMDAMNIISENNIQINGGALMNAQMKSLVLLGKNIILDGAALMNCHVGDIYIKSDKLVIENTTFYNLPNLNTLNVHAKKFQCKTDDLDKFPTPKLKSIWVNNIAYPTLAAALATQNER